MGAEVRGRELRHALALGEERDRLTERMLRRGLDRRREGENVVAARAERHQVRHGRPPIGERAGLVEDHRVGDGEAVEHLARLHQQADRDALPPGDRGEHRRRDAERTGVAHDDRGQEDERRAHRIARHREPAPEREARNDEDDRAVVVHEPVREQLEGRFALGDVRHQPDDLAEERLLAHLRDANAQLAVEVEGSADHRRAQLLRRRDRFAGEARLIDARGARHHFAIERDALARAHDQCLTDGNLAREHLDGLIAAHNSGAGRLEREQSANRFGCLLPGVELEVAEEEMEGHEPGGDRQEVRPAGVDDGERAHHEGTPRASGEEDVRVDDALADREHGFPQDRVADPQKHHGRHCEAEPRSRYGREREDVQRVDCEVNQREHHADDRAPLDEREQPFIRRVLLRLGRRDLVAELLNGGREIGAADLRGIGLDEHDAVDEVDEHAPHARIALERLLDRHGAERAHHAGDLHLDRLHAFGRHRLLL